MGTFGSGHVSPVSLFANQQIMMGARVSQNYIKQTSNKMDLSNVVFLEDKPKQSRKNNKGNKKKKDTGKDKVKKVPLKRRAVKHNKPQKPQNANKVATSVVRKGTTKKKVQKVAGPRKTKPVEDNKLQEKDPSQHWNKIPPKDGEPKTKKHNGKTYHWCPYCKFWAFHKPGKGQRCQAVDPLGHLLTYFGGGKNASQSQSQPQSQNAAPIESMDWDEISL